jgi:phage terminase large subunit-like protein
MSKLPENVKLQEIREAAEADLVTFIKLIAPYQVLGSIHEEVCSWWTREDAKTHQLVLLPRDHSKSRLIAYRAAWELTKDPTKTILYISATTTLAEKQLSLIKQFITSEIYRRYWPDHINVEEGKRELWNVREIALDHPSRRENGIRDPTVFTAGLGTTITGMHFDIVILDDLVVRENAYTEEGRSKVRDTYSLLASIESAEAKEWAVGTRYHPKDLYEDMMKMEHEVYDDPGEVVRVDQVYEILERPVESRGDGTGEFLWPRQRRYDGKWFGFDQNILAQKRAKYMDKTQFYAQYYNRPEDRDNPAINPATFQYYDRSMLDKRNGRWTYNGNILNVFASIDFAFSRSKKADWTALVVIGVDSTNNIYVLDIITLKTDRISDYYKAIMDAYVKWEYSKIRAEVSVAQQAIVRELKESYIKPNGMSIRIEEYRPSRSEGTKEERVASILEPRYDNLSVWHYRGGNCQLLEEELVLRRPPHDDIKDCLASAIAISCPPMKFTRQGRDKKVLAFHPRFGGVAA